MALIDDRVAFDWYKHLALAAFAQKQRLVAARLLAARRYCWIGRTGLGRTGLGRTGLGRTGLGRASPFSIQTHLHADPVVPLRNESKKPA